MYYITASRYYKGNEIAFARRTVAKASAILAAAEQCLDGVRWRDQDLDGNRSCAVGLCVVDSSGKLLVFDTSKRMQVQEVQL